MNQTYNEGDFFQDANLESLVPQPDFDYKWYFCEIRSFLQVPKASLRLLDIETFISQYSYMDETHVYLEPDSDAQMFIDAVKDSGKEFSAKEITVEDLSYLDNTKKYEAEFN